MTPDQCREARELLRWTQGELAEAADVPSWFVVAFEDEDSPAFLAHYEIAMREALEAAGINFETDDVQFKPAGVTYSPRGKDELN
jgi:transcriptional regulator with XRE-family HTH domain